MIADTYTTRYATYADLEGYMYGSAGVVGLMCSRVLGATSDAALEPAKSLGYAMQLTNFLRDIAEDIDTRGRIYLPQEDMKLFGITDDDIVAHRTGEAWNRLMRYEIKRAQDLFACMYDGIGHLPAYARYPVMLSAHLYAHYLVKIEQMDYNIYTSTPIRISRWERMKITYQTYRELRSFSVGVISGKK
jgi:15-cis-phytoene synthase